MGDKNSSKSGEKKPKCLQQTFGKSARRLGRQKRKGLTHVADMLKKEMRTKEIGKVGLLIIIII